MKEKMSEAGNPRPTLQPRGWGTPVSMLLGGATKGQSSPRTRCPQNPTHSVRATLYDGVGSVKRHLDSARRKGSFFSFFPERIFSLSCISTKARFVNPAVESGSTNHLCGLPRGGP